MEGPPGSVRNYRGASYGIDVPGHVNSSYALGYHQSQDVGWVEFKQCEPKSDADRVSRFERVGSKYPLSLTPFSSSLVRVSAVAVPDTGQSDQVVSPMEGVVATTADDVASPMESTSAEGSPGLPLASAVQACASVGTRLYRAVEAFDGNPSIIIASIRQLLDGPEDNGGVSLSYFASVFPSTGYAAALEMSGVGLDVLVPHKGVATSPLDSEVCGMIHAGDVFSRSVSKEPVKIMESAAVSVCGSERLGAFVVSVGDIDPYPLVEWVVHASMTRFSKAGHIQAASDDWLLEDELRKAMKADGIQTDVAEDVLASKTATRGKPEIRAHDRTSATSGDFLSWSWRQSKGGAREVRRIKAFTHPCRHRPGEEESFWVCVVSAARTTRAERGGRLRSRDMACISMLTRCMANIESLLDGPPRIVHGVHSSSSSIVMDSHTFGEGGTEYASHLWSYVAGSVFGGTGTGSPNVAVLAPVESTVLDGEHAVDVFVVNKGDIELHRQQNNEGDLFGICLLCPERQGVRVEGTQQAIFSSAFSRVSRRPLLSTVETEAARPSVIMTEYTDQSTRATVGTSVSVAVFVVDTVRVFVVARSPGCSPHAVVTTSLARVLPSVSAPNLTDVLKFTETGPSGSTVAEIAAIDAAHRNEKVKAQMATFMEIDAIEFLKGVPACSVRAELSAEGTGIHTLVTKLVEGRYYARPEGELMTVITEEIARKCGLGGALESGRGTLPHTAARHDVPRDAKMHAITADSLAGVVGGWPYKSPTEANGALMQLPALLQSSQEPDNVPPSVLFTFPGDDVNETSKKRVWIYGNSADRGRTQFANEADSAKSTKSSTVASIHLLVTAKGSLGKPYPEGAGSLLWNNGSAGMAVDESEISTTKTKFTVTMATSSNDQKQVDTMSPLRDVSIGPNTESSGMSLPAYEVVAAVEGLMGTDTEGLSKEGGSFFLSVSGSKSKLADATFSQRYNAGDTTTHPVAPGSNQFGDMKKMDDSLMGYRTKMGKVLAGWTVEGIDSARCLSAFKKAGMPMPSAQQRTLTVVVPGKNSPYLCVVNHSYTVASAKEGFSVSVTGVGWKGKIAPSTISLGDLCLFSPKSDQAGTGLTLASHLGVPWSDRLPSDCNVHVLGLKDSSEPPDHLALWGDLHGTTIVTVNKATNQVGETGVPKSWMVGALVSPAERAYIDKKPMSRYVACVTTCTFMSLRSMASTATHSALASHVLSTSLASVLPGSLGFPIEDLTERQAVVAGIFREAAVANATMTWAARRKLANSSVELLSPRGAQRSDLRFLLAHAGASVDVLQVQGQDGRSILSESSGVGSGFRGEAEGGIVIARIDAHSLAQTECERDRSSLAVILAQAVQSASLTLNRVATSAIGREVYSQYRSVVLPVPSTGFLLSDDDNGAPSAPRSRAGTAYVRLQAMADEGDKGAKCVMPDSTAFGLEVRDNRMGQVRQTVNTAITPGSTKELRRDGRPDSSSSAWKGCYAGTFFASDGSLIPAIHYILPFPSDTTIMYGNTVKTSPSALLIVTLSSAKLISDRNKEIASTDANVVASAINPAPGKTPSYYLEEILGKGAILRVTVLASSLRVMRGLRAYVIDRGASPLLGWKAALESEGLSDERVLREAAMFIAVCSRIIFRMRAPAFVFVSCAPWSNTSVIAYEAVANALESELITRKDLANLVRTESARDPARAVAMWLVLDSPLSTVRVLLGAPAERECKSIRGVRYATTPPAVNPSSAGDSAAVVGPGAQRTTVLASLCGLYERAGPGWSPNPEWSRIGQLASKDEWISGAIPSIGDMAHAPPVAGDTEGFRAFSLACATPERIWDIGSCTSVTRADAAPHKGGNVADVNKLRFSVNAATTRTFIDEAYLHSVLGVCVDKGKDFQEISGGRVDETVDLKYVVEKIIHGEKGLDQETVTSIAMNRTAVIDIARDAKNERDLKIALRMATVVWNLFVPASQTWETIVGAQMFRIIRTKKPFGIGGGDDETAMVDALTKFVIRVDSTTYASEIARAIDYLQASGPSKVYGVSLPYDMATMLTGAMQSAEAINRESPVAGLASLVYLLADSPSDAFDILARVGDKAEKDFNDEKGAFDPETSKKRVETATGVCLRVLKDIYSDEANTMDKNAFTFWSRRPDSSAGIDAAVRNVVAEREQKNVAKMWTRQRTMEREQKKWAAVDAMADVLFTFVYRENENTYTDAIATGGAPPNPVKRVDLQTAKKNMLTVSIDGKATGIVSFVYSVVPTRDKAARFLKLVADAAENKYNARTVRNVNLTDSAHTACTNLADVYGVSTVDATTGAVRTAESAAVSKKKFIALYAAKQMERRTLTSTLPRPPTIDVLGGYYGEYGTDRVLRIIRIFRKAVPPHEISNEGMGERIVSCASKVKELQHMFAPRNAEVKRKKASALKKEIEYGGYATTIVAVASFLTKTSVEYDAVIKNILDSK